MEITLHIPDDLAARLGSTGELERRALEALALDEFRLGHLSRPQLRKILGFATRGQLDTFLTGHGFAGDFTRDDLERDRADLARFRP